MEFLYRNATPAYKGSHARPTRTGLLAGLGSVLGSGARPAYRTVTGANAQASAPARSWLRAFAVTPSYKTAAQCAAAPADPCAPSPDEGDDNTEPACGCDDQPMQVVIL
jgi:hypothetical protein